MTHGAEFKEEAVHGLRCVNEMGFYYLDGILVKTARSLLSLLGISSSTLYAWDKKTGFMTLEPNRFEPVQEEPEPEVFPVEVNYYNEFDMKLEPELETVIEDDSITMTLDNTYFMTLARALKVKNYRMPIKQLYLKIGSELIKRSGLVENGVREELRMELERS